jgi:hypothetical protein
MAYTRWSFRPMVRTRDMLNGPRLREFGSFVLLLLLAILGISAALDDQFAWWARVAWFVGLAGPLTVHLYYKWRH